MPSAGQAIYSASLSLSTEKHSAGTLFVSRNEISTYLWSPVHGSGHGVRRHRRQLRRWVAVAAVLLLLLPVGGSHAPRLLLGRSHVVGVVGQVGEDHPLLVVVLTQDLVVAQVEAVANAKSEIGRTF